MTTDKKIDEPQSVNKEGPTPAVQAEKKTNGAAGPAAGARRQRTIKDPNELASLVLMHIDAVHARKDDLTAAVKNLADITKQLTRAYGEHTKTIKALQQRIRTLEEKEVP